MSDDVINMVKRYFKMGKFKKGKKSWQRGCQGGLTLAKKSIQYHLSHFMETIRVLNGENVSFFKVDIKGQTMSGDPFYKVAL